MEVVKEILDPLVEEVLNKYQCVKGVDSKNINANINNELEQRKIKSNGNRKSCPLRTKNIRNKITTPKYQIAKIHGDVGSSQKSYSSILNRPFIFRRTESLDNAVSLKERRLMQLYTQQQAIEEYTSTDISDSPTFSITITSSCRSPAASTSSFETNSKCDIKNYIKQLSTSVEEDVRQEHSVSTLRHKISVDKIKYIGKESTAMAVAQKYLAVHRIFEFYQFLIAHLLSALPDNPINFLLMLLDNCLTFRAGMTNPPLLYEKKHLEALFDMMDRMKFGYISTDQYIAAMKSIGICTIRQDFYKSPHVSISKKVFVEDALTYLQAILYDILRRKNMKDDESHPTTPPPTPLVLRDNSDLFFGGKILTRASKNQNNKKSNTKN